jgi:iron complex transport system substrate-binding protein
MRIKKIVAVTFLAVFMALVCSQKAALSSEDAMTVIDMAGRTVKIPKDAGRGVVCVGPGTLRLITYLEATDKVAAIESGFEKDSPAGRPYRIAHPELTKLPTIGQASPLPQPNPEAILYVKPDIIFISYVEGRVADDLEKKTGIPVIVLSYGSLAVFNNEDVFNSLRLAGRIIAKTSRAEAVIRFIKDCEKDLSRRTEKIPDGKRPKVYVGGLGFKGTHGITSTEYGYPAFELLRARNVAGEPGKKGHVFVDKEKILEWDPDIIFIDGGGMNIIKNDCKKNPEFYELLTAARNENVYGLFPYNHYTVNIGTALADAYYIGKTIYPECFKDISPENKADEIYAFLVGRPVYDTMKNDWDGFMRIRLNEKR